MDIIYYITAGLMIIVFLLIIVGTGFLLLRPHHLRSSKHPSGHMPRAKIAGISILSLVFATVSFGTVLAATEPESVRQARQNTERAQLAEQTPSSTQTAPSSTPKPIIKTETKVEIVPYESKTEEDASLTKGSTKVTTAGVNGEQTITYEVTYIGNKETGRREVARQVTKEPVAEVTAIGTYVTPVRQFVTPTPTPSPQPAAPAASSNCDRNYSGCVPVASDVDCAGGNGNGPAYVSGPIQVIGTDIYDLDHDGNGIACE